MKHVESLQEDTPQDNAATVDTDLMEDLAPPETGIEEPAIPAGDTGWRLWPPSPKMQIALIALGFGLFNTILIAIWAVVMVYRF